MIAPRRWRVGRWRLGRASRAGRFAAAIVSRWRTRRAIAVPATATDVRRLRRLPQKRAAAPGFLVIRTVATALVRRDDSAGRESFRVLRAETRRTAERAVWITIRERLAVKALTGYPERSRAIGLAASRLPCETAQGQRAAVRHSITSVSLVPVAAMRQAAGRVDRPGLQPLVPSRHGAMRPPRMGAAGRTIVRTAAPPGTPGAESQSIAQRIRADAPASQGRRSSVPRPTSFPAAAAVRGRVEPRVTAVPYATAGPAASPVRGSVRVERRAPAVSLVVAAPRAASIPRSKPSDTRVVSSPRDAVASMRPPSVPELQQAERAIAARVERQIEGKITAAVRETLVADAEVSRIMTARVYGELYDRMLLERERLG